jgi:hypothetical protein
METSVKLTAFGWFTNDHFRTLSSYCFTVYSVIFGRTTGKQQEKAVENFLLSLALISRSLIRPYCTYRGERGPIILTC